MIVRLPYEDGDRAFLFATKDNENINQKPVYHKKGELK